MRLEQLLKYLDEYLALREFPGTDPSKNGLQVEGCQEITCITSAVDACMETFNAAQNAGAHFIIVHHGIFWGDGTLAVTGIHGRRIKYLLKNDLSLYAMHLPLDIHPEIGNNAQLAKILKLKPTGTFGNYRGCEIGVVAQASKAIRRSTFAKKVEHALNSPVRLLEFGPEKIKRVAIVSGGGASEIPRAAKLGFDLLLTGEGSHSAYHQAKEGAINVLYAGHYATETLGVKALGNHLQQRFGLCHTFLEAPTGF